MERSWQEFAEFSMRYQSPDDISAVMAALLKYIPERVKSVYDLGACYCLETPDDEDVSKFQQRMDEMVGLRLGLEDHQLAIVKKIWSGLYASMVKHTRPCLRYSVALPSIDGTTKKTNACMKYAT